MGRRRFLGKRHASEDMVLQITSMADIFTIILVFLLKTFSTSVSTITPSGEIVLPSASSQDEVKEALKIEISPNVIMIDDKTVTTLHSFRFEGSDVERDGTARSLNTALMKERKRRPAAVKAAAEASGETADATAAQRLMVLADQKTPYATVRAVLNSASNSGFTEFKLVVVQEE